MLHKVSTQSSKQMREDLSLFKENRVKRTKQEKNLKIQSLRNKRSHIQKLRAEGCDKQVVMKQS